MSNATFAEFKTTIVVPNTVTDAMSPMLGSKMYGHTVDPQLANHISSPIPRRPAILFDQQKVDQTNFQQAVIALDLAAEEDAFVRQCKDSQRIIHLETSISTPSASQ
jgi:hypothetical protein